MTVLAALLATVSSDAPLSTSYGVPSHGDSYGGHGGHETVKRHAHAHGQDCNCNGGIPSGGSSYNGGSASVHPARQPTRPDYNNIVASPRPYPQHHVPPQPTYSPPASVAHPEPFYSTPSPQTPVAYPQPQHPAPPPQPQPVYSPPPQPVPVAYPQPQHPAPPPQPQPVYSPPPQPVPVAYPQPQYPVSPPQLQPVYSPPSPPALVVPPQPQLPPPTYDTQPAYSSQPQVQYSPQPTKPNYNAIQAPAQPPAPSPVYSGRGQPTYSGGRPDYNAYPPQGYAGWGLSTKPYNFGYSVKDFHQGTDFKQQETSDGNTVKGQYRVQLPDGRLQIVTYTADWQTGFHADVQYEGEASYPAVYGVGGSYPPSSHHSSSYGAPAQTSYSAPAQTSYSAPAQTSYSAPQASYGAPSTGSSGSGWNQGAAYQERVGVGGVGSQYLNIGHSTGGSSYGTPTPSSYGTPTPSSYGTPTSSSYHPSSYGK